MARQTGKGSQSMKGWALLATSVGNENSMATEETQEDGVEHMPQRLIRKGQ